MKITVDVRGLDEIKKKLSILKDSLKEKALSAAINKVAAKAQTEINRAITEEYAVKSGEVRNAMDLRRARKDKLEAVISVFGSASRRGRSANMVRFLAVAQAAGMQFKTRGAQGIKKKDMAALKQQLGFIIKKGGGLKKIEGAFLGNKGRTVFMREGKGRLPIKPVQVIGFSQMFNSKKINKRVMDKIDAEFAIELDRAIKMVIDRNY